MSALAGTEGQPGPHLPSSVSLQGGAMLLRKGSAPPPPQRPSLSFHKAALKAPSRSSPGDCSALRLPPPSAFLRPDAALGRRVCARGGLSPLGFVWLSAHSGKSEMPVGPLYCPAVGSGVCG